MFSLRLSPLLFLGLAQAQDSSTPAPSPHVPAGFELVWNDEFSGPKLDTTKWGFPSYKVRDNALMNTPGTVTLNGSGHLVLSTLFKDGQVQGGPPPDGKKPAAPLGDLSKDFRTYGLLWTAEKCEFFCDDFKIMEDTKAVSQIPEFIVLSLLSSGWERPRLDTAKLPDSMSVDYVRVYAPTAPKSTSR